MIKFVNSKNFYMRYLLLVCFFCFFINTNSQTPNSVFNTLVWFDEFDGNGDLDTSKWYKQTKLIAGDSWANNEQQHYTTRLENSYVSDGTLKIKAIKESFTDQNVEKQYTSARLNSTFAFTYGRVEVRAKLPSVAGTWPAIWLLGKNIQEPGTYWDNQGFGTESWPKCGEIDIMEPNVPKTQILATWHWDNGSGYQYNSNFVATSNTDTSQNFHIYSLEWTKDSMKIYMDGVLINQMQTIVPFDKDFFVLLNLAMGGNLGGTISSSFSSDILEIDYVRIYQENALSVKDIKTNPEVVNLYPNPVIDVFSITLEGGGFVKKVEIFDVTGKKILQSKLQEISLKNFQNGIYLAKITTNKENVIVRKIIKK